MVLVQMLIFNRSTISVTSNNNGGGTAAGVLTSGNGTVDINNSAINAAGNSGSIAGVVVGDPTATANLPKYYYFSLYFRDSCRGTHYNAGTLNDNGENQCFQTVCPFPADLDDMVSNQTIDRGIGWHENKN
ncbi:hypothetical protein PGH45_19370 [Legionella pneumophila]|nr:hypothetical protein [Legionella pneumophila]